MPSYAALTASGAPVRVISSRRLVSVSTRVDRLVAVRGLVVEQAEMTRPRHLAELDADDVARVPPVGPDRDGVGERIHRVEDHEVGIAKERDVAFRLHRVVELVLGIGRVDDRLAVRLEAIAVGIAGVPLQHRRHRHARDRMGTLGLEVDEIDVGVQEREIHRKRRLVLLAAQRRLEPRVAAVDVDAVARECRPA